MSTTRRALYKLSLSMAIFVLVSSGIARGQDASPQIVGIPDDWTHHHVVFSSPGTAEQAMARGEYDKWSQITSEPRFKIQQLKRRMRNRAASMTPEIQRLQEPEQGESTDAVSDAKGKTKQTLKKDWSMLLGGTANATGTITANNASSSSIVTVDGTALDASAPTDETATITFSATAPALNSTVTIGSVVYTFETSNITTAPATNCEVYSAASSTGATSLYQAITHTGTQGNTNYRCASSITSANSAVTAGQNSATISLTATALGMAGFTFGETGTTNFTTFTNVAGTNGTQNGTTWTYWSGAAAATAAQVAANIASTINTNSTLKSLVWAAPGTNSSGQAVVTVYAQAAGTSGDYSTAVSGFTDFTWSGSLTGSESQTAGLNNSEWFPLTYFYSATQGECDNNAPSADYVAFNTGLAGSANQPTIIAYDNLYSGCPTTSAPVPNIYWQYNTGATETISTSPVVSLDGTQVAFVQTNGTSAQLVILRWAKNSALQTLTSTSSYASSTGGCTAPCMVAITFANVNGGASNDTTSSPFYDYAGDIIYVGDTELTGGSKTGQGRGYLHKFTNVFNINKGNTQPAEVTATFPVLISASNPTDSPILDNVTEEVLVGPTGMSGCTAQPSCGVNFHEVNVSTGVVTTDTNSFNNAANTGQTDTPILDPVAGFAYAFTPADGGGNAAVWQYHVDTTADFMASNTEVTIGAGDTANNQFSGTFDNLYFEGATTGYLYVCGRATGTANTVTANTIWRIPITTAANALGTAVAGPAVATAGTTCSAVSEYYTGSNDYIFLSVQNDGVTGLGCTASEGCIISFDVTSASGWGTSKAAKSATAEAGGTGGLVIDNAFSNPTGEGNVYFFPLSSGTCGGSTPTPALDLGTGICGIQVEQSNVAL